MCHGNSNVNKARKLGNLDKHFKKCSNHVVAKLFCHQMITIIFLSFVHFLLKMNTSQSNQHSSAGNIKLANAKVLILEGISLQNSRNQFHFA